MQVGILQFFGWRDRSIPLNAVYASALERLEIMDRTGYDPCLARRASFLGLLMLADTVLPRIAGRGGRSHRGVGVGGALGLPSTASG